MFYIESISTIISNYSSELTVNSEQYSRLGGFGGDNYYQAIPIRVNTTGTYTFTTSSTIGNTFGYLYQGNFYPTYPQYNIITQDDDSSGNQQFRLTADLRSDITYILVFTTYEPQRTGSFSISASGPDYVFFNTVGSCSVNEVFYQNHCYYLDGNGGQCLPGYSLGSKTVLSQIASSFTGLNYKTAVSDNCCVKTLEPLESYQNYGMSNQCNTQGPFTGGPILNGGGCGGYTKLSARQLTFCGSN